MCTSVAGAALLGLPFAMALLGELLHSYTNSSTLVLTTAPFRVGGGGGGLVGWMAAKNTAKSSSQVYKKTCT